jgi:hypothetical protein
VRALAYSLGVLRLQNIHLEGREQVAAAAVVQRVLGGDGGGQLRTVRAGWREPLSRETL